MPFSRLLLMNEREQRMIEYFRYELTPVPTSLFEDGMMRKSAKSVLMKAVTKNVPKDAYYVSSVYILDGGVLLRKIKWIPHSTAHNVILQYSQYIKFKYGLCFVAFDGYDERPSIKDHEHLRRSKNASSYIKVDLHNQTSCSQKAFLKNSKSNAKFIELLSKHLANDGHDIRNSKDDADTLIVSTAIQYTKKQDNEVVVVANDTDIIVLLIYHWQKSMTLFMHSEVTKKNGCEKRTWKIEDVLLALALGNEIARHILFIHARTGCDTTSAIYFNSTI